jgi:CheY-like chemotaxis protein
VGWFPSSDIGSVAASKEPRESAPDLGPELPTHIRASFPSTVPPEEPAIIVGMPILSVGVVRENDPASIDDSDWDPVSPARTASAVEWAEVEFVPPPSSNGFSKHASADSEYIEVDENDLVPPSQPEEEAEDELVAADMDPAALEFESEAGHFDSSELDFEPPTLHIQPAPPSYRPGPTFHTDLAALHKELAEFDMKPRAVSAQPGPLDDLAPLEPAKVPPEPTPDVEAPPNEEALEADSQEKQEKGPPRPSVAPAGPAPVVMIVEDDASIRQMLTHSLGTDYCVYEASDGVIALDMLSRMSAPDLLLLDVRMPRMDGLALAVHVRQDTRMRMVPIIFLTGLDSPHDVVNGINAGARQYVTKPFKMKELKRRVDRALAHRAV